MNNEQVYQLISVLVIYGDDKTKSYLYGIWVFFVVALRLILRISWILSILAVVIKSL